MDCGSCHIDPLGGGALTDMGKGYYLSLNPNAAATDPTGASLARPIQIFTGFFHITFAFLWFGTILYVHLVLKPAYASQGLPRGEVRVGFVSMAVLAVSGVVLTYYKISDPHLLVSSRFGILLLAKIIIFLIMALSAVFVVTVLGPRLRTQKRTLSAVPGKDSGEMTRDELAACDGKDDRPAYFAYQGKIYDAGGSELWPEGNHMQRHGAGSDLTAMLSQAPHGEEKIRNMPVVGKLIEMEKTSGGISHTRVFYFMAYMNLTFVFVILLILTLWRWG